MAAIQTSNAIAEVVVGNELESLDFFTDPSLVADPYPYYDAIRECPVRREPHDERVLGVEAGVNLLELDEAAQHQPRPDE